jgi:hypothetical protein
MARRLTLFVALVATLTVAACGGGATTGSTGAPGTPSTSGTARPASTSGPAATTAPGTAPGVPGADDALAAPCGLLTVDEAAGAMGTDPLTSTAKPGDPATCSFLLAADDEALWVTVVRNGAAAQFQAFVDNGSAEEVANLGDAALFEPSSRRLVFKVADLLVLMFARYANNAPELETTSALARIIISRLTTGEVPPELQITAPPVIAADAACDLLSAAEAEGVLGLGALSVTSSEFTPQFCTYALASGEVVLSTFLQPKGGIAAWPGYESGMVAEPVSGLADKALFEESTGILLVLSGDTVMNVNVFGQDPAATLDIDSKLARIMLTHL